MNFQQLRAVREAARNGYNLTEVAQVLYTSQPGVSASDRKVGDGHSGTRNVSKRAAKKGGAKLEDSATGKPSRKSTRKSTGGVKRTSNLRRKATRKAKLPPSE